MALVMGISDHVVVLDAGSVIARRASAAVSPVRDPRVLKAYLGDGATRARRPRATALERPGRRDPLSCLKLSAGYGAAPVIEELSLDVKPGEMVALLGANGAGQVDHHAGHHGLVAAGDRIDRARRQQGRANSRRIGSRRAGVALVPEGRAGVS